MNISKHVLEFREAMGRMRDERRDGKIYCLGRRVNRARTKAKSLESKMVMAKNRKVENQNDFRGRHMREHGMN